MAADHLIARKDWCRDCVVPQHRSRVCWSIPSKRPVTRFPSNREVEVKHLLEHCWLLQKIVSKLKGSHDMLAVRDESDEERMPGGTSCSDCSGFVWLMSAVMSTSGIVRVFSFSCTGATLLNRMK